MSNEQQPISTSPFDNIKQTAKDGGEYWSARDLARVFEYGEYRFFRNVIQKAEQAAMGNGQTPSNHFVQTHGMVTIGSGARRRVADVLLVVMARTSSQ